MDDDPFRVLSAREREVAKRLAMGEGRHQIAAALGLSVKTVDSHRVHVLAKLGLNNAAQLTWMAIYEGLVGLALPAAEIDALALALGRAVGQPEEYTLAALLRRLAPGHEVLAARDRLDLERADDDAEAADLGSEAAA